MLQFLWHKIKYTPKTKQQQQKNSCSHGWVCEVLWENIKGCTGGEVGMGWRAQFEDLLTALADRRSFPETLFFVARGMLGETWSTESVVPAGAPVSVLMLPVKEPGRKMKRQFEDREKTEDNDGERQSWSDKEGVHSGFVLLLYIPACSVMHVAAPQPRLPSS